MLVKYKLDVSAVNNIWWKINQQSVLATNTNHSNPHKSPLLAVILWSGSESIFGDRRTDTHSFSFCQSQNDCLSYEVLSALVWFEVILTQIRMKFCVQIGRRTSSVGQENDKIQYTFYKVVARCNKCRRAKGRAFNKEKFNFLNTFAKTLHNKANN